MGISTLAERLNEGGPAQLHELPALPLAENLSPDLLAAHLQHAEATLADQSSPADISRHTLGLGWLNSELAAATPHDEAARDYFDDARVYMTREINSFRMLGIFHATLLGLTIRHLDDRRLGRGFNPVAQQEDKRTLATLTNIVSDAPLHDHDKADTLPTDDPQHIPCLKERGSRLYPQTVLATHLLFIRQGLRLTPASLRERKGPDRHTAYVYLRDKNRPLKLPVHITVKTPREGASPTSPVLFLPYRQILQDAQAALGKELPHRIKNYQADTAKWLAAEAQDKELSEKRRAILDQMGHNLSKLIKMHLDRL